MDEQVKSVIKTAEDLLAIPIESITKGKALPFVIYFKLNENKFILLAKPNSPLDWEKIEKYQSKGMTSLFIRKNDKRTFFTNYLDDVNLVLQDKDISIRDKADVLNDYANTLVEEIYSDDVRVVGPKLSEASMYLVQSIIKLATEDPTIVESFVQLSDINKYQYNHVVACTSFCISFATFLGYTKSTTMTMIGLAGLLHDVGNKFIDPEILNKKGTLTFEDLKEIKKHPGHSSKILQDINHTSPELREVVLQHHEQWNGTGYPNELKGKEINSFARILSICDSFTAMICTRTYGKKYSVEKALEVMFTEVGKYDPELLAKFFDMLKKQLKFRKKKQDVDPRWTL